MNQRFQTKFEIVTRLYLWLCTYMANIFVFFGIAVSQTVPKFQRMWQNLNRIKPTVKQWTWIKYQTYQHWVKHWVYVWTVFKFLISWVLLLQKIGKIARHLRTKKGRHWNQCERWSLNWNNWKNMASLIEDWIEH